MSRWRMKVEKMWVVLVCSLRERARVVMLNIEGVDVVLDRKEDRVTSW